jgi:hypothetical protein
MFLAISDGPRKPSLWLISRLLFAQDATVTTRLQITTVCG